jgi:hypothetical protein
LTKVDPFSIFRDMKKLSIDQINLILTLFWIQNADKDLTDFVSNFGNGPFSFSKTKKIKDLKLKVVFNRGVYLLATDDDGFEWCVILGSAGGFEIKFNKVESGTCVPFDIMKYISLEDKV